ncbi:MAG: DUF4398 domain-containing protein, partial [Polyangiaceae bacterium]
MKTPFPCFPAAVGSLVASLATSACGGAPPHELQSARSAYNQAARGPAATLDPTDVHKAGQTLQAAEQAYDQVGNSQDTRDLAYTAERRAEIAQVRADAINALRARDNALALIGSTQASALERTKTELARANARLSAEQAQAAEAERRADEATTQLAHVADIRRRQQDVV